MTTTGREEAAALERLERNARLLAERRFFLLFSHEAHFWSPLVQAERDRLRSSPAIREEPVHRVIEEVLVAGAVPRCAPGAPPAIFFPAPLARALADGVKADAAVERFHYDLVHVDPDQRWTWRGVPVAPRTRAFLLEHTRYEAALERFVFEYRVNAQWWDKSYLEAAVTPFVALSLEETGHGVRAFLQDGRAVDVLLDRCRLDRRERLFLRCEGVGEALCSDTLRFRLLATADEALDSVRIGGQRVPWTLEDTVPRAEDLGPTSGNP